MNRLDAIDAQARLNFFHGAVLVVDGAWGLKSRAAYRAAGGSILRRAPLASDPILRHHASGLRRVVLHWTAGAKGVIDLERRHYHAIIGQDARVYMGDHQPEANGVIRGAYAAHTRGLNTGSIGVALDAMAGAREVPFSAGSAPITQPMLDALANLVTDLCETYSIPVTPWTVLTHAEVQRTLGVRQRAKWDVNWLPGMDRATGDPRVTGDRLRVMIRAAAREAAA